MNASKHDVALVTGAAAGIGAATVRALLAAGITTYASGRRLDALAPLAAEGARTVALDVTDEASRLAAVRRIENEAGALTILVNNAGYGEYGVVEELALDAIRAQFETNVFGLVRLTQLVLPMMRLRGGGTIVNLSSVAGEVTLPAGGAYHASKHALESFSDALRFEVAPFGIRVVVIQPGVIRTGFGSRAIASAALADAGDPAYAALRAGVRRVFGGGGGAEPDGVARLIVRAVRAQRPRARYRITPEAHLLPLLRTVLTDRAWDAALRTFIRA